ncbi:GIGANTEA-like protein, partial [Tanacetum coccineum]
YYVIPSPSGTQRLLLGLLEAPPSWTPDAIDVVVQFLPRNWMQIHFLRAIGTAMSIGARIAAARQMLVAEAVVEAIAQGIALMLCAHWPEVATDVASRGLDVTGVAHVVNQDLPKSTVVKLAAEVSVLDVHLLCLSLCQLDYQSYYRV